MAVQEGTRLLARQGIDALRERACRLTSYLIGLADAWLAPLGCALATPRDPLRRGSHVSLQHPEAWRISQALIRAGVIGDYRAPDRLRLGLAPIYTRFTDVWDALSILRQIIETQAYANLPARRRHLSPATNHAGTTSTGNGRSAANTSVPANSGQPAHIGRHGVQTRWSSGLLGSGLTTQ